MITSFFRAQKILKISFTTIVLVGLVTASACSTAGKRPQSAINHGSSTGRAVNEPSSDGASAAEPFGPFPAPAVEPPQPPGAPAELVANPDRIVLVFGRGLTQGYTYVGVLRALAELKVPIHAIYATEVGALAAALYFTQPNANRIDWALLRFNEKNLRTPDGKFSFVRIQSPETELSTKLREVFGERRVESISEKLHITLEDAKTGETLVAKSGDLWRAIRGAMAGVNGFSPEDFEGRQVRASARGLSVEYGIARQNEKYPVVVVSVGAEPPLLFRKLVESQKATLLSVPLPGIDDLDLKKRNQAVFSGKKAVHQAANEILGLIGRKLD